MHELGGDITRGSHGGIGSRSILDVSAGHENRICAQEEAHLRQARRALLGDDVGKALLDLLACWTRERRDLGQERLEPVEPAASMAAAPPKPAFRIQKVVKPGSTEQPDMKAF